MNRFGIRLAAGLAVVCLGCLAIFQAQQDKNDQLGDAWPSAEDVAAAEPPAPLGISSDWPALPDEAEQPVIRGNGFPADDAFAMPASDDDLQNIASNYQDNGAGGVQLASFDQPADSPDQPAVGPTEATAENATPFTPPTFSPPPISTTPSPMPTLEPADDTEGAYAPAFNPPSFSAPSFTPPALDQGGSEPPAANNTFNGDASTIGAPSLDDGISNAPTNSMRLTPLTLPQDGETPSFSEGNVTSDQGLSGNVTLSRPVGQDEGQTYAGQPNTIQSNDPLEAAAANWPQPGTQAELTPLPSSNQYPGANTPPAANANDYGQSLPSEGMGPIGSGLVQPFNPENQVAPLDQAMQPSARVASRSNVPSQYGSSGYAVEPQREPVSQPSANYPSINSQLQTVDKSEILAEPGTRDLEGAQTPSVLVQKRAPAEIRVGKPAQFVIAVKNVGTVAALDVRVFDTVPVGTTLESTLPPAENVGELLVWQLGDLGPGEERALTMSLVPEAEGELGSVARVTFEAAASVRTVATQPNVQFVHRAPQQVLIGQQMEVDVEIKNTGTGTSDNVVVLAELPEGLESTAGRSLKLSIGAMPPGATHRDVLRLRATKPGMLAGQFQILDSDGVINEVQMEVQVISPKLEVALQGPSMRYLERQATYNVQIANSGTADASDIDLIVYLDRGLKFVSTEYQGKYDPTRHAVFWALEELKANEVGEVPLTLLPVEAGQQKVRVETTGALGVSARSERELSIETLAELSFSIADDQDPIEPGAFTTYEIRVKNTGSRDDTNVVLEVQIPHPGLQLVTAEPSAKTDGQGKVIFEPIGRIPAKGEQIYRIRVRGQQADTHIMRATLASAQSKRPVTKEESTTVYQDQ